MGKVKILFVLIHMGIGGIEKSFLNLMQELSKDNRYKIDILLFTHRGDLLNELPDNCNLLPEDKNLRLVGITQKQAFNEGIINGLERIIVGGITKYISKELGYKILMHNYLVLNNYDIAISYLHSKSRSFYGGTNEFVLNKVRARKKFTFIHGDFVKAKLNTKYNRKLYAEFEKIICVSNSGKNILIKHWPELQKKVYVIRNCCNVERIKKLSLESIECNKGGINFVTIARLDPVKGIERTVKIFYRLNNRGYDYKWHIIGGGEEKNKIEKLIKEYHLEEKIILYGEKKNPYPYIALADALLLVSFQEAAPLVFQEAQCLRVPILSTDTLSAKELVQKENSGIVCDNSEEGIEAMLETVILNPEIIKNIRKNIPEVSNKDTIKQFEEIVME